MKQYFQELTLDTAKKRELIKITSEIENAISVSLIQNGLCVIFSMHATAGIIINEDEEGLKEDFLDNIDRILPTKIPYKHNISHNNAASHIANSLFGQSETLVIKDGRLERGMWQEIFFLELDGPREERKVLIKILGE